LCGIAASATILFAAQAEANITTALNLRKSASLRSRALDQGGLAQLHLLRDDVEQAVHAGHLAVDVATRTQSGRVRSSLRDLHTQTTKVQHLA
jgi:hypothetical protein